MVKAPTKEDMLALYKKNWVRIGYESKRQEEIRKAEGRKIMERYFDNVFSMEENPIRLEESFSVHFADVVFGGKIDRIDLIKSDKGIQEVYIVDYKTGSEKSEGDIKKDLQLPLYALVAEEKFGLKVVGAKYVFVETGNSVEVNVSQDRREEAKEKLIDSLESIKKGNFKATPGFVCRFCDFNSICEYADL